MKLKEWVESAKKQIDTLDCELIAIKTLGFSDRIDIIMHWEDEYDFSEADKLLEKRKNGLPFAYISGEKEFFGRKFKVNQNVLIPRPETEQMIISALGIIDAEKYQEVSIVDVGTGSGCIAVTLKLELWNAGVKSDISGVDYSVPALDTAQENADDLGAYVKFFRSDLLLSITELPDIITANLPYVDMKWDWTSPELKYEPAMALYADDGGLKLIKKLIDEIVEKSDNKKKRFLLLEADTSQHDAIIEYAKVRKFELISHDGFIIGFKY